MSPSFSLTGHSLNSWPAGAAQLSPTLGLRAFVLGVLLLLVLLFSVPVSDCSSTWELVHSASSLERPYFFGDTSPSNLTVGIQVNFSANH